MQLRRGQTPDSRSPPQHYCIFKPLSPCGNSQFDDADLQCWQASVTISFSQTKKGCSLQCFLLRKSPHLYGHVCCCQEKARRRKQLDNKTARRPCCWVARLPVTVEIKRLFSYQIIAMIPSSSSGSESGWKHSFLWNFGITATAGNASKTDVLKVSCCLHGLLHLPGKPSMYCDCMD